MKKYTTQAFGSLEIVAGGETVMPAARKQIKRLTSREVEVLQFVAEGKLSKQAAAELCVSAKTIEKHREHITKKLGIRGIAGMTHFAISAGIVRCNPQLAMA